MKVHKSGKECHSAPASFLSEEKSSCMMSEDRGNKVECFRPGDLFDIPGINGYIRKTYPIATITQRNRFFFGNPIESSIVMAL